MGNEEINQLIESQLLADSPEPMEGILSQWSTSVPVQDKPITREDVRKAMDKVVDMDLQPPCTHAVHPDSRGWTMCGQCFAPVFVSDEMRARWKHNLKEEK